MPRVYTHSPSDELSAKIHRAVESIRNKESRNITCPYCSHTVFTVYADSIGFVKTKCNKCKQPVLVDLVSMRRMNRKI